MSTRTLELIGATLEPALKDAIQACLLADAADPVAFVADFLARLSGQEGAEVAQLRDEAAQLRAENEVLKRRLAAGDQSRAEAAWEPFKALLDGKGAGREAEAGKFGEGVDFLQFFQEQVRQGPTSSSQRWSCYCTSSSPDC